MIITIDTLEKLRAHLVEAKLPIQTTVFTKVVNPLPDDRATALVHNRTYSFGSLQYTSPPDVTTLFAGLVSPPSECQLVAVPLIFGKRTFEVQGATPPFDVITLPDMTEITAMAKLTIRWSESASLVTKPQSIQIRVSDLKNPGVSVSSLVKIGTIVSKQLDSILPLLFTFTAEDSNPGPGRIEYTVLMEVPSTRP